MKTLKIESNGAPKFSTNNSDWRSIEDVNKEDISLMLDLCINHDVILEDFDSSNIKKPA